jgi:hypothetical protein
MWFKITDSISKRQQLSDKVTLCKQFKHLLRGTLTFTQIASYCQIWEIRRLEFRNGELHGSSEA